MLGKKTSNMKSYFFWVIAATFILLLHGAVPFIMMPTAGLPVWAMGYAQSLAQEPFISIYAKDFGLPHPEAIAFGLAGVLPASIFIRIGLDPADAYSTVAAIWILISMYSAYRISRILNGGKGFSLLAAVAWSSSPIIWVHAGYTMLSWGIALLSFYFLATINLIDFSSHRRGKGAVSIFCYFIAVIISIFMDGYTFMMFAVGASIFVSWEIYARDNCRSCLIKKFLPIHFLSFSSAYILYVLFIGQSSYEPYSIDFFRGWGLDLSFLAIPTKGVLWIPDLLGISVIRTDDVFFGDGSVWQTTFALPILLIGLVALFFIRGKVKNLIGILIIISFSFYMALGPSVKINSTKPESLQISHPKQESATMPAEYAVAPTGNAWISEFIPGFDVMRASYRWAALGIFGVWLLIIYTANINTNKNNHLIHIGLCVIIIFNLPNLNRNIHNKISFRNQFLNIDRQLVPPLKNLINKNDIVAFIPWGNDFMATYLAPRAGFRTFNIGGDKNLNIAKSFWPKGLLPITGVLDAEKIHDAIKLLIDNHADAIVIPNFNMRWAVAEWPCKRNRMTNVYYSVRGFNCPDKYRKEYTPLLAQINNIKYLKLSETEFFSVIRIRPEFAGAEYRSKLLNTIVNGLHYPIVFGEKSVDTSYTLRDGWYNQEPDHVWSKASAKLALPIPNECKSQQCTANLNFQVFAASKDRPVTVTFSSGEPGWSWNKTIVANSSDIITLPVPLKGGNSVRVVSVNVPETSSPYILSGSPDKRILGISLTKVELVKQP